MVSLETMSSPETISAEQLLTPPLPRQLRNLGFITELANHGGEALDFLKTSTFWSGQEKNGVELAVILMDLEMPVMDGLTCARIIREFEVDGTIVKHVPIIAVTANARLEQIETAIAAGMVSFISPVYNLHANITRTTLFRNPSACPS